ncbi:hypothetical protein [Haloprofundus salinisoli]|uniref:hypothetical protein n=1 Tax=Haloprofundus salinisoli TaxID=2876193 RepID=UPI001CCB4D9C|nr:hypothetical protein [Haloprofundus salinisoli]
MVSVERISFVTTGHEADEQLIREYIVPSLNRLETIEGCEGVRFSRFGQDTRYEKSEVILGIYGEYEAVVEAERERWDELVEEGFAESWSRKGMPFANRPEDVQEILGEAYILGSHMAAEYYETFDERPGLVEEVTDDAGRRYGLWSAFHVLANNIGCDPEEEVDAYDILLRDRLIALTELRGHDFVRTQIDELRAALDELEETVDELEEQGGFEYYDGPE